MGKKKDILKPLTAEDFAEETPITAPEVNPNYRECTCGELVLLPTDSEDVTLCKCGVKHAR